MSNYIEWNKTIEFHEHEQPEDAILAPLLATRLWTKLKYLRVDRLEGSSFRMGLSHPVDTEFFVLRAAEEDDASLNNSQAAKSPVDSSTSGVVENKAKKEEGILCMKYGNGVLIVDDHVSQFNLKEVR